MRKYSINDTKYKKVFPEARVILKGFFIHSEPTNKPMVYFNGPLELIYAQKNS